MQIIGILKTYFKRGLDFKNIFLINPQISIKSRLPKCTPLSVWARFVTLGVFIDLIYFCDHVCDISGDKLYFCDISATKLVATAYSFA